VRDRTHDIHVPGKKNLNFEFKPEISFMLHLRWLMLQIPLLVLKLFQSYLQVTLGGAGDMTLCGDVETIRSVKGTYRQ